MEDKVVKVKKLDKFGIIKFQSKPKYNDWYRTLNLIYMEDGSLYAAGDDEIEVVYTDKEG